MAFVAQAFAFRRERKQDKDTMMQKEEATKTEIESQMQDINSRRFTCVSLHRTTHLHRHPPRADIRPFAATARCWLGDTARQACVAVSLSAALHAKGKEREVFSARRLRTGAASLRTVLPKASSSAKRSVPSAWTAIGMSHLAIDVAWVTIWKLLTRFVAEPWVNPFNKSSYLI